MGDGDTFTNSLIGALVIVLSTPLFPFSPLFGGAVGGFLQGPDREEGLKVGTIAGLIAFLPVFLGLVLLANLFLFIIAAGGTGFSTFVGSLGVITAFVLFLFGIFYVVLLSTAGGWLGSLIRAETSLGSR